MKIYISGKITGEKHFKRKFAKAEREVKRLGHEVINPAKMNAHMPKSSSWEEYMIVSLAELSTADAIYMLQDWQNSKGARIEYRYAEEKHKVIIYEEV